ncbi:MAG: hypothetical protein AAF650_04440 [Pseudomonadota bacterium]
MAGPFTGLSTGPFTGLLQHAAAKAQTRVPIDLGPVERSAPGVPTAIDILNPPPEPAAPSALAVEECDDEIEASEISGEIVVCRKLGSDAQDWFSGSYADWFKNYADRTRNANTIPAPDVDNTQHPFAGSGVSIRLVGCFIPPCPGPHALLIDVENLPAAPVGTDADRMARGLAPRGFEGDLTDEAKRRLEAELDLPPTPDFKGSDEDRASGR